MGKMCVFWASSLNRTFALDGSPMFPFSEQKKAIDPQLQDIHIQTKVINSENQKKFHKIKRKSTANIQNGLLRFNDCRPPSTLISNASGIIIQCSPQLFYLFVKNFVLCYSQFNNSPSCPPMTIRCVCSAKCKRSLSQRQAFERQEARHFHFVIHFFFSFSPVFALLGLGCIERVAGADNGRNEIHFYYKSNNSICDIWFWLWDAFQMQE